MIWLVVSLIAMLATCVIAQWSVHRKYVDWLASREIDDQLTDPPLRVAVVLCLRGADDELHHCLDRLARLDYPSYTIHTVIDNTTDSSVEVVLNWQNQHTEAELEIHYLTEISPNCYLKTSAIRQCLKSVGDRYDVAVMVDADTLVYPLWLRDLVAPFKDHDIGLVTGNRWYDPTAQGIGSKVRFMYNAWSIAPMYLMNATWGGSLAMSKATYSTDFFFERMLDTSSEESAMQAAARHAGKRLVVHPNVILCDRSSIDLASCFRFIRRQLLWTRLYHPQWASIQVATLGIYLLQILTFMLAVILLIQGEWWMFLSILSAMVGMIGANLLQFKQLCTAIAKRNEAHQKTTHSVATIVDWLAVLACLPIAFLTFVLAVFAASVAKRVAWRGVVYEVHPPKSLRLVEYRPFRKAS